LHLVIFFYNRDIAIHHQPIIIHLHNWGVGLPYALHIRRTSHNPPRGSSAFFWVLMTANAAGTNGLTCLPKHRRARDDKVLVTHPTTDQRYITCAIARTDRGAIELLVLSLLYTNTTLVCFHVVFRIDENNSISLSSNGCLTAQT
jgi:hypothetical protein